MNNEGENTFNVLSPPFCHGFYKDVKIPLGHGKNISLLRIQSKI
jgi:hypothetical protein